MVDLNHLAPYFDYVEYNRQPLDEYCEIAKKYQFKCVATSMFSVEKCKILLKGSDVLVSGAVAFPGGNSSLTSKLIDIEKIIQQGGDEVDYVVSQYYLENNDWDYVYYEMKMIADFCKYHGIKDKAIVELCKYTQEEKIKICEIAKQAKPAFVKTSTGHSFGGATIDDVKLIRSIVGDACEIKASGGIKTLQQAIDMIEAGANRLGLSNAVKIMDEAKNKYR